jgi:hypothetical protein
MRIPQMLMMLAAGCSLAVAQRVSNPSVRSQNDIPNARPSGSMLDGVRSDPSFPSRVTGTILAIDNARRLVMIERADKSRLTFLVDPKVRTRADKDTELAGRKNLSLGDYRRGQVVSITYRAEDSTALEIRLRRPRS